MCLHDTRASIDQSHVFIILDYAALKLEINILVLLDINMLDHQRTCTHLSNVTIHWLYRSLKSVYLYKKWLQ